MIKKMNKFNQIDWKQKLINEKFTTVDKKNESFAYNEQQFLKLIIKVNLIKN